MISLFGDVISAFFLGLLTPLGAVCVIPLYPGFLAYLSNQFSGKTDKKTLALMGLVITSGVVVFMLSLGLIFTTFLEISLTNVIGIISPIAFGTLGVISLLLIFNVDISKWVPKIKTPQSKNPLSSGFLFGFFFGAIVVPCNPLFIAALFAKTLTTTSYLGNLISFLFFGIGIGFPLIVLSLASAQWNQKILGFLTRNRKWINLISGLIMLGISVYYLFFVFKIF